MSQPLPPDLPPRFRDVAYVAEGAFGHVFSALGEGGRRLAIKVLAPTWLGDPDAVWRFTSEYRRLAGLDHPAIPGAVEEGVTGDGRPFFAMAFVPGEPLDALAPLPPARAREVLAKVASALGYLHGVGLAHGDLKAANVLVAGETVSLLDVGSAAPIGQRRESIEGTPEYMAPDVLRQAEVAPEADWYALGVLGYLLLAGRTPFMAGTGGAAALVRAQLHDAPPALPAEVTAAAPALASAVMSLLAKEPERRAAALGDVYAALGLVAPARGEAGLRAGWVPRPAVEEAWACLVAPDGADALVLAGPAGAGKSRALDALRLEARLAGRAWIAASCGGTGDAPGSVARVLLRQTLATAGLPASEHVAAWLAGGLPADWLDLEPRARKVSLFGALADAWASATGALGGVIVGLDDWHLADATSREIVEHLRATAAGRRTRWCLAAEPDSAPTGARVLPLADWTPDEVAALVAARLGAAAPAGLIDALAAVGADRPGLVNALVDHWAAGGALRREHGGWQFSPSTTADRGEDLFARLWRERLERLSADAIALARLAGLAYDAGPLPAPAFGAALELGEARLHAALDALLAAGVLASAAGGVRLAVGSHAAVLAEALEPARRAALATRLARLALDLGAVRGPTPDDAALLALPLPVLVAGARLAARGDDDDLAIALAGAAARRALEHMALPEALRTLADARQRLTDAVPAPRRLALYLVGGEAARLSDRLDEAADDLERALAIAESTGDELSGGQALLTLCKCRQLRGRYEEALELSGRAERMAERAGNPVLGARAAVLRARVELFTSGHAAARATLARAVALATAGRAPAWRSAALNLQGVLLIQDEPHERDAALGMIREAIALAEGVGDLVGVAAALENLGNAQLATGDLREAKNTFARDADHCRAHGIGTEGLSAEMNHALVLAALGEVEPAGRIGHDVASRAATLGRTFIRAMAQLAIGQAAWRAGRVAEGLAMLDESLALARSIENRYAEAYIRLDRLEAFLALGERDRAADEAAAVGVLVDEMALTEVGDRRAVLRGELARQQGDATAAATLAAPYLNHVNRALVYAAHGVLGRTELDAGRPAGARGHFEAQAAIARDWHAPWHLAAARWGLARASADGDEAAAHAREALAVGPNPFARAGAASLLAAGGGLDAAGREALDELEAGLAGLEPAARERVLAAQGLPDAAALAALRRRAPVAAPAGHTALADLAAWHDALLRARDEADVHQTLLSGLMAIARADRGYLLGYEKGRLLAVVTTGVDYAEEVAQGFSSSIAEEALFTGETIYLIDAAADERWRESASVQALQLRTVVAVPYATPGQLLGVVYMDRAAIEPMLGADDLAGLAVLAGVAAHRVADLRTDARRRDELDFERLVAETALAVAASGNADPRGALLEATLRLTGAQRAFWLAREGGDWDARATRAREGVPPPFRPDQISQTVLAQATDEREPVCLIETDRPETWTPGQSLLALGIRMVWCLAVGPDATEAIYVDTTRLDALDPRALLGRIEDLVARFAPLLAAGSPKT